MEKCVLVSSLAAAELEEVYAQLTLIGDPDIVLPISELEHGHQSQFERHRLTIERFESFCG